MESPSNSTLVKDSGLSPPTNSDGGSMVLSDEQFNSSIPLILSLLFSVIFVLGFLSVYLRQFLSINRGGSNRGVGRRVPGVDSELLKTFPLAKYQAKGGGGGSGGGIKGGGGCAQAECVVCLGDFEEGEAVQILPRCGHLFHPGCISLWLFSHTTCPLCRRTVLGKTPSFPPEDPPPLPGPFFPPPLSTPFGGHSSSDIESQPSMIAPSPPPPLPPPFCLAPLQGHFGICTDPDIQSRHTRDLPPLSFCPAPLPSTSGAHMNSDIESWHTRNPPLPFFPAPLPGLFDAPSNPDIESHYTRDSPPLSFCSVPLPSSSGARTNTDIESWHTSNPPPPFFPAPFVPAPTRPANSDTESRHTIDVPTLLPRSSSARHSGRPTWAWPWAAPSGTMGGSFFLPRSGLNAALLGRISQELQLSPFRWHLWGSMPALPDVPVDPLASTSHTPPPALSPRPLAPLQPSSVDEQHRSAAEWLRLSDLA